MYNALQNLDRIHKQIELYTWLAWGAVPALLVIGGALGAFLYWLGVGNLAPDPDLAFLVGTGGFLGGACGGFVLVSIDSELRSLKYDRDKALSTSVM